MSELCERCGKRPIGVSILESLDGVLWERNLCDECAGVKRLPPVLPMEWQCACGRQLRWEAPLPDCPHGAEGYELAGEERVEAVRCECGVRFTARITAWQCRVCGRKAIFPPQMGGPKGFLRSYLYGSTHMAKVELEGRGP